MGNGCGGAGGGGRSALDYLIKVRDYTFMEAVETLAGLTGVKPPVLLPAVRLLEYCLKMGAVASGVKMSDGVMQKAFGL